MTGESRRFRHVGRLRVLAATFAIGVACGVVIVVSSFHDSDSQGVSFGIVLGLISFVLVIRSFQVGTTLDRGSHSMTIRYWTHTRRLPCESVHSFATVQKRGRKFPAAVLNDDGVLGLPQLERGLIHEARGPADQWGEDLAEMNAWLLGDVRLGGAGTGTGRGSDGGPLRRP